MSEIAIQQKGGKIRTEFNRLALNQKLNKNGITTYLNLNLRYGGRLKTKKYALRIKNTGIVVNMPTKKDIGKISISDLSDAVWGTMPRYAKSEISKSQIKKEISRIYLKGIKISKASPKRKEVNPVKMKINKIKGNAGPEYNIAITEPKSSERKTVEIKISREDPITMDEIEIKVKINIPKRLSKEQKGEISNIISTRLNKEGLAISKSMVLKKI